MYMYMHTPFLKRELLLTCPYSELTCSYDDPEAKEGDVVCYGQPVALVTLPEEGGQVS